MKTDQELIDKSKRELFHMFGAIGFERTVKLIADIAQEFGDSDIYKVVSPEWLEIAAIMSDAYEKIVNV